MTAPNQLVPSPSTNGEASNPFQQYDQSVATLCEHLPSVFALLHPGDPIESLDGWSALVKRHAAFRLLGGTPVLVATMCGPTGAGKSTLFRCLTAVQVPAGDVLRPMSYACALAVPQSFDGQRLSHVFPDFDLQELQNPGQLTQKDVPTNRLYFTRYEASNGQSHLPLLLADVPDFDSFALANWDKAEAMMARAEVVLFVVQGEKYADDKVIEILARCCRLAGRLIYVVTKVEADNTATGRAKTKQIWEDLVCNKLADPCTSDNKHIQAFQSTRSDGQTLLGFLGRSPVYFSPRVLGRPPRLEDIEPLAEAQPSFMSLLQGLEAEEIVLSSLLQPVAAVVGACARILEEGRCMQRELAKQHKAAKSVLGKAAGRVAGSQFPIGRFLEIVLAETRAAQPWYFGAMSRPVSWVTSKATRALVSWLQGSEEDKPRSRAEFEKEHLGIEVEWLLDKWRGRLPDAARDDGFLSAKRCIEVRDAFLHQKPPEPQAVWEEHVRQSLKQWMKDHPWRSSTFPFASSALIVVGISLIVVDLTHTGGMGMASVIAAGAAGSFVASLFLKWVEAWQLKQVLKVADAAWREQRTRELREHLREHFFTPLFQPSLDQRRRLKAGPFKQCRQACDQLNRIASERQTPESLRALFAS